MTEYFIGDDYYSETSSVKEKETKKGNRKGKNEYDESKGKRKKENRDKGNGKGTNE